MKDKQEQINQQFASHVEKKEENPFEHSKKLQNLSKTCTNISKKVKECWIAISVFSSLLPGMFL